mmetsp:Transcript_73289/g.116001  ORF Transcript_73289/g.116001 Transcript_73289/m.116001 type:complete len:977 (-) Transcript_73289:82-3012(-)
MQGDGSDDESGEARRFKTTRPQGYTPRETGRRKAGRSIAAAVDAALQHLNDSSDEDGALPRARHIARFRQRKAQAGGEGEPKRAKQSREKKGSMALEAHYNSLLEEETASTETPTVEETSEYLAYLEKLAAGEDVKPPKGKGRGRGTKRRIVRLGEDEKTHVRKAEQVTPEKAEDDDDETTPSKEARLRHRGGAGKGGGKRAGKKNGEASESEEEETGPSRENIEAWEADLAVRVDKKSPDNLATAFSIRMRSIQQIRQLDANSYLGGKKQGGKLLFDDEKKVNVHFLLGIQKELDKMRQRKKRGEQVTEIMEKSEQQYVRWLMVKALKLRVVNKSEMRAGAVGKKRIEKIQKSNRWSLALSYNLADNSEDEDVENEISPELVFKARERAMEAKEDSKDIRKNLRAQIESRVAKVSVSASHNVDLEEVQELLMAPSLSFDWSEKQLEDDEADDGMGMLEVELPDEVKKMSKRELFHSQLHRARSFNQAKGLTNGNRTKSNSSLGSAPADGTATSTQEDMQRTQSAPSIMTSDTKELDELEKPRESKLWERLEAKKEAALTSEKLTCSEELHGKGENQKVACDELDRVCGSEESKDAVSSKPMECEVLEQVMHSTKSTEIVLEDQRPEKSNEDASASKPAPVDRVEGSSDDVGGSEHTAVEKLSSGISLGSDTSRVENETGDLASKMEVLSDAVDVAEACKDPELHEQEKQASSDIISEDWHGIPPTAMWVMSPLKSPISSFDLTQSKPNSAMPAAAKDNNFEISPTLPMLPGKDHQLEISPTLPMVPNKDHELEISPTLPMIPMAASNLPESKDGVGIPTDEKDVEISPTMPMIPDKELPQVRVAETPGDRSAIESVPTAARNATVSAQENDFWQGGTEMQLADAMMSDDSLSDDNGEDVELGEDQFEIQQNPEQRRREREWLRHKRKAARQEVKDAMLKARKRKAIEVAKDSLDENDVFGGFSGGIRKKKSFLSR